MPNSKRIVFAGTPEFAVPVLRRLIDNGLNLVGVYTQPDRPSGRGRRISRSPVKLLAIEYALPVMQPVTFKEAAVCREFRMLRPDIMIVAAYGQILPTSILDVPKYGCLNVHASLLPRWRGAAPVARAIEAGDTTTGITIMLMDAGMDTGAVIAKSEINVDHSDNSVTLMEKLAALGAEVLLRCLPDYLSGELTPVPQDEVHATYAPKLKKSEAPIDWARSAEDIRNKIRALNPWPVAHTKHQGNRIRVLEAEITNDTDTGAPETCGSVCRVDKRGIAVACGQGMLRLTKLQRDHGKPLPARDFLNGYSIAKGDRLLCNFQREP